VTTEDARPPRQGFLAGTVPVWLLLLFLLALLGLGIALALESAAARRNGLAADSLVAARDTTRLVAPLRGQIAGLAAERAVWQRRAIQAELAADSLDRKLKQRPKAAADVAVVVRVDTLRDTTVVRRDDADTRMASFHQYRAPFRIWSDVTLPATGPGSLETIVLMDSLNLIARVICGASQNGITPATIEIRGPAWAGIGIRQPQTDPGVCNPRRDVSVGLRVPAWTHVITAVLFFFFGLQF
jgi:hypothetical protein